jgi:hypothetical protein
MLSAHSDDSYVNHASESGAVGFHGVFTPDNLDTVWWFDAISHYGAMQIDLNIDSECS